jgi:hypothetical protein
MWRGSQFHRRLRGWWISTAKRIWVDNVLLWLLFWEHRGRCFWRRLVGSWGAVGSYFLLHTAGVGAGGCGLALALQNDLPILAVSILPVDCFTQLLEALCLDLEAFGIVDLARIITKEDKRFKGGDWVLLLVDTPEYVVEEGL